MVGATDGVRVGLDVGFSLGEAVFFLRFKTIGSMLDRESVLAGFGLKVCIVGFTVFAVRSLLSGKLFSNTIFFSFNSLESSRIN